MGVLSLILFAGTVVLSTVIAINEKVALKHSLMTKGHSFASYIAKVSQDPMILKDNIQLDSLVNEANKDEDIGYVFIQDAQGNLMTSQYASINYARPRLKAVLSGLSNDRELPDIIAAIKKKEAVLELSVPVRTGADNPDPDLRACRGRLPPVARGPFDPGENQSDRRGAGAG